MPKPTKKTAKTTARPAKAEPKQARAAEKREESGSRLSVYIDYPAEGETIPFGYYTFRLGAVPPVEKMDVSVDGGPWQSCRAAEGYWWYDWMAEAAGEHRITARATGNDFSTALSDERTFRVG